MPKYLNIAQAARLLGCDRDIIYRWIERYRDSALPFPRPHHMVGARRYWKKRDLQAWIRNPLHEIPGGRATKKL